jgi:hypothetical protein
VRSHPPALKHGELEEVLPGIYFVTGTIKMGGPVRFSRNMTVVKNGDRLVLVNSVRLDDAGLAALDKLGKVTDVIRLAGNHGMDDPFYAERYGAKVWVVKGQRYTPGFREGNAEAYFEPHHEMDATTKLPIDGAKLVIIDSKPPEGLLLLQAHGGVMISGDCLQHWATADNYFSFIAKFMAKRMGFIKPHNVGPAWLKNCKPPKEQLRGLLDHSFANALPAHGRPVLGNAADLYRPVLEKVSS